MTIRASLRFVRYRITCKLPLTIMNLLNMYKDIYTHMCGIIESGWLMVNLNLGDHVRKSDNWPNFPAMEVLVFRVGSIKD